MLLPTGTAFDVIEVPARLGEAAIPLLGTAERGPVAVTPTGRWMFFVRAGGALRPELADRLRVILHAGGSWVPAPPTRFPEGPVLWRIPPGAVGWRLADHCLVQRALVPDIAPCPGRPATAPRVVPASG